MTPLKKIGLVAAVLLFAALVCVPGVLAAGPGQGMPDTNHQGTDHGPSPGGSQNNDRNDNGNNYGPGQGSSGTDNSNDANRGADRMAGNMTQRQGRPPGNSGNMTGKETAPGPMVLGNMTSFGPGERFGLGNMTFCNATGNNTTPCQPFDGNATQAWGNETRQHQYGDNSTWQFQHQVQAENGNDAGNTPSANGNAADKGSGQGSGQNSSQNQKDADLISAFLAWLNGGR